MKKLFVSAFLFVALPAMADNTNIGVDANANAFAGAQANPTQQVIVGGSSGGTKGQTLFMPNSAASVVPNVNQFVKSGPGPAEKSANVSRFMAKSCAFAGGRAKPEIISGDNATLLWLPYEEPENKNGSVVFEPMVTDFANEFLQKDSSATYYCLGQVTIKPVKDDENQDLYDPLILANEALRILQEKGKLSGTVTPVVFYDQTGYIETTEAEGSGLSITPQITGGPAVNLVAGSIFSWQKNGGWVSPNYRLVLKVFLLAEAPNESLGHPIVADVKKVMQAELERKNEVARQEAGETQKQAVGVRH